ncbi:aldehyde oxidase [Thiocystis violacea]|nr:molybdopterin cofactor-binding domain-containing protein [Thiocystis violacea]MBK1719676.1 aldehyde oxidase [Thiocystis violacea]
MSGSGLSRRAWLKVGALMGGGLVLSLVLPSHAEPVAEAPDADSEGPAPPVGDVNARVAPNAWIRIHGDGRIQLTLARSEMGQGVMTSLPMLLAEELEVGLDQIQIEPAGVAPVYGNPLLGEQATGGGTSTREAWDKLREAGAVARVLMISAAAAIWGVPESECRARRASVHHVDGTRSLSYGELASRASELPVPPTVALKTKGDWTLIGTSQRRLDTPGKVRGTAGFGLDTRLPGMLFATIERCPVIGSRVESWRAGAAKAVPGVVDVLAVRHGIAVVADSTWAALVGRERLVVECRPKSDPGLDSERLRARLRAGLTGRAAVALKEGDVSLALASSAQAIEAVYALPFQAHACMEPMNCTADVRPDGCDIHVPTQAQSAALETARRVTGLPSERIAVHTTFLGGGYGRRREQDFVLDAVELSMMLKRPVQVIWTREDDLQHDYYRPMTLHRLRGGLDAEGHPSAWFHRIVGPSVLSRRDPARVRDGLDPLMLGGAAELPYRIPHRRLEYRRSDSPVSVGLWRGEGYSHNCFVTECFLDELARAAGQDPLVMRQRLLAESPRHRRLLERIAERSAWHGPLTAGVGRGLALIEAFGSLLAVVAEVSVEAGRPSVRRVVCVVDSGQLVNPDAVRAQIEGGVVFGLSATLKGEITLRDGRVEQSGFGDYPLPRFDEMPEVEVTFMESDEAPGGVSGLATPAIAPAVANALSALQGTPIRSLPIRLA